MDDGKSIRYKDLYALFEQILEKTMRLEQRDWSESPVKVWVNTFKVFLDEYMIEYKPLDYTAVKVLSIFGAIFLQSHAQTPGLLSSLVLRAEVGHVSRHTRLGSLVLFYWAQQTQVLIWDELGLLHCQHVDLVSWANPQLSMGGKAAQIFER